ncbi:hypothetical protein DENSPDRAFT_355170 [Dentipellis sp. KUC8613]|nr:hypothetical protein DENSPDRAFT_355170 [Dentipellis sp. KUC8613]
MEKLGQWRFRACSVRVQPGRSFNFCLAAWAEGTLRNSLRVDALVLVHTVCVHLDAPSLALCEPAPLGVRRARETWNDPTRTIELSVPCHSPLAWPVPILERAHLHFPTPASAYAYSPATPRAKHYWASTRFATQRPPRTSAPRSTSCQCQRRLGIQKAAVCSRFCPWAGEAVMADSQCRVGACVVVTRSHDVRYGMGRSPWHGQLQRARARTRRRGV